MASTGISTTLAGRPASDTPSRPGVETSSLGRWWFRHVVRTALLAYNIAMIVARAVGWRRRPLRTKRVILATGQFNSSSVADWHLHPLAASRMCHRLYVVTAQALSDVPGTILVAPKPWAKRLFGARGARLWTYCWLAFRIQPDIVAGFGLLPNGLLANMLARLVRARSMYCCISGPEELQGGGTWRESGPLARLETPDAVIERRLIKAVAAADLIITTGTRAAAYFREKGIVTPSHVIEEGADSEGSDQALRRWNFALADM